MSQSEDEGQKRKLRYGALEALPPQLVGEIVGDELFASPRPAAAHAVAASALGAELISSFQFGRGGPGGWWLLFEPELHLGPDVLVPDLAGWRRERMPVVPDVAHFTLAPDWICEVLSSRTRSLDRIRKLPAYARAGVGHAWLLDPTERSLEVYRLVDDRWLLVDARQGSLALRAEPFDTLELDLSNLWIGASAEEDEVEA